MATLARMIWRTAPRNGGKPITELRFLGMCNNPQATTLFMVAAATALAQARQADFCVPCHRLIQPQRSHYLSTLAPLPASLFLPVASVPNPARSSPATALHIPRHGYLLEAPSLGLSRSPVP